VTALVRAVVVLVALAVVFVAAPAAAQVVPIPVDGLAPAERLAPPEIETAVPVAPAGSRCPELYPIVVEHWPAAAVHWPLLDHIFWREARCRAGVVNRVGCVGLMQICRGNHARLGVTRADLLDPVTNIETGYRLCAEQTSRGRSCWRPWWLGRWRP
jgi:soluble lytic murein transglycosylase-like protein